MGPYTAAKTCVDPDFHSAEPSARCSGDSSHDNGRRAPPLDRPSGRKEDDDPAI